MHLSYLLTVLIAIVFLPEGLDMRSVKEHRDHRPFYNKLNIGQKRKSLDKLKVVLRRLCEKGKYCRLANLVDVSEMKRVLENEFLPTKRTAPGDPIDRSLQRLLDGLDGLSLDNRADEVATDSSEVPTTSTSASGCEFTYGNRCRSSSFRTDESELDRIIDGVGRKRRRADTRSTQMLMQRKTKSFGRRL